MSLWKETGDLLGQLMCATHRSRVHIKLAIEINGPSGRNQFVAAEQIGESVHTVFVEASIGFTLKFKKVVQTGIFKTFSRDNKKLICTFG